MEKNWKKLEKGWKNLENPEKPGKTWKRPEEIQTGPQFFDNYTNYSMRVIRSALNTAVSVEYEI